MYPIVLVAVAGIVLAVERFGYLLAIRPPPGLVDRVLELLRRGASGEAAIEAGAASGPTARLLRAGIKAHGASQEQRETAMESALLTEAPHIERSLALIGTLAAVAPLLGLLGTVSGLIATFNTIATVGTANPRLLSGGISEAIITTQLGLMVGIPLLLMHAWLNRWAERAEAMLECDAIQVFGLPPKTHSSP
ncbi:MAG: MotA/TolQ/ExbB proton channel family protein [Verrucomicrobia bacterium]|nr:MotA/TolQ/ExbB proton channel family protein [Verrucomicrobiota bacterium]